MGKNVTLANRLKRLEQRLPPPRMDPTPRAIMLGMLLSVPEIHALRDLALAQERRGEPINVTAEMRDILQRRELLKEEMERESKPAKLQGAI